MHKSIIPKFPNSQKELGRHGSYLRRRQRLHDSCGFSRRRLALGLGRAWGAFSTSPAPPSLLNDIGTDCWVLTLAESGIGLLFTLGVGESSSVCVEVEILTAMPVRDGRDATKVRYRGQGIFSSVSLVVERSHLLVNYGTLLRIPG